MAHFRTKGLPSAVTRMPLFADKQVMREQYRHCSDRMALVGPTG
jgi:hypothetical protein